MAGETLRFASVHDISLAIASRAVSPVDCVKHSVDMIERHNEQSQAFLSHDANTALAEAAKAEGEIMRDGPRSPVHGIPFGVKDLIAVRGMQRTCGSRVYPPEICTEDAHVVRRLREAGAIMVGMTSPNEFAYGPTGINAVSASPRNPWDMKRACGGSSSGSGCAVSTGFVPAALGTDTGGSVRVPAAICGVTGLKPSYGLTSRTGIQPLCITYDHPGPLAHTAWDCGMILEIMAGQDRRDPSTWNRPTFRMPEEPDGETLKGCRIGILESYFREDVTSDVASVFDATLEELKSLGCSLTKADPAGLSEALECWNTACLAEAYHVHEQRVRDHHDDMSPDVSSRLLLGREISTQDYLGACRQREIFQAEVAGLMERFDFLVTPTTLLPAISLETGEFESDKGPVNGSQWLGRLTRLANQTGQPAISVPCGFTPGSLPVGLQMIGHWFGDGDLIRVAAAFQQHTDWHSRHPPAGAEK
ncbi:MAG: amidase [Rhizobiaceae bacterium]